MIPESVFKLAKLEKLYPHTHTKAFIAYFPLMFLLLLSFSGINTDNNNVIDVPGISALKELRVL